MNQAKIKITVFVATVLLLAATVGFVLKPKVQDNDLVSIDFDAYFPSYQKNDVKQLLLKIELKNSLEDVLKYGLETPEEHQERLSYYFKNFKKDVFLVTNTDTIVCLDAHLERTYMDAPKRNFILNFHLENDQEIKKLLIADQIYSGQLLEIDVKK